MNTVQEEELTARDLPRRGIVALLVEQHEEIRRLLTQVHTARGEARRTAFARLREQLAVHETAEQVILRPITRSLGSEAIARTGDEEEQAIASALAELEQLDPADGSFGEQFTAFADRFTAHADREEHEEYPLLATRLTPDRQVEFGNRLVAAERSGQFDPNKATTDGAAGTSRPAPPAATGPAALGFASFAEMADQVREHLVMDSAGRPK